MRLFIAINVPEALRDTLSKMRKMAPGMRPDRFFKPGGDFHITLQFLGDGIGEEAVEAIQKTLSGIEFSPFEVELGVPELFPDPFEPIGAWVPVEPSAALLGLADQVRGAMLELGYKPDKPFRPHITLGRFKAENSREKLRLSGSFNAGRHPRGLREPQNGFAQNSGGKLQLSGIFEPLRFRACAYSLMRSELTQKGPIYTELAHFGQPEKPSNENAT